LIKKRYLTQTVIIILSILLLIPLLFSCAPAAEQSNEIILGVPVATGFPDGASAVRNINFAVEEINNAGGVNVGGKNYTFAVEVMDTRDLEPGVPTSEALLAVEKLILEKNADFLVGGPIRSEAALAAMDLLSKYQTISIISSGVLSPAYDKKIAEDYDKYRYCFRTSGSVVPMIDESISVLDSIRNDYEMDSVFMMVQDVAHARSAGDQISAGLEEKGWNITGYEKFPTGTSDFSMSLLKAWSADTQILFMWFDMPEAAILMKQAYDMRLPVLQIGYVSAGHDSTLWETTEGKCAYLVDSYQKAGIAPTDAIPLAGKYIEAYNAEFGVDPCITSTGPICYQVVYLLKDALERAGTLDTDKVITALEETDLMGVYGRIRFDPLSHQIVYSMDPAEGAVCCWTQWIDGKRVVVYPPKIATAPILMPPWMYEVEDYDDLPLEYEGE
jgi:branched-chain amino acid transport system substrate-binding protein